MDASRDENEPERTAQAYTQITALGPEGRQNAACVTCTYPHTFRIVFEPSQSAEHSISVFLPLSFAEDYF